MGWFSGKIERFYVVNERILTNVYCKMLKLSMMG